MTVAEFAGFAWSVGTLEGQGVNLAGVVGDSPTGSVRESLVCGGSDRRIVGIPKIGVKAGSLPDLKRADLSRWLDDFAFSFPAPGIM